MKNSLAKTSPWILLSTGLTLYGAKSIESCLQKKIIVILEGKSKGNREQMNLLFSKIECSLFVRNDFE